MTGDWPEERHGVAYAEARAVIEAQNATMTDIDDKAMRTVRLNAILLGLLVTGLQFSPGMFQETTLTGAFVLLIASTICGVVTYNESDLYVGPGGEYVTSMAVNGDSGPIWAVDLLRALSAMIKENRRDLQRNAMWLTVTQGVLVLGVVSAVLAVVF